tara:strand:- start:9083 stop:9283 length:201 start_codon:yes stop_codon:yes gene_type:complete
MKKIRLTKPAEELKFPKFEREFEESIGAMRFDDHDMVVKFKGESNELRYLNDVINHSVMGRISAAV